MVRGGGNARQRTIGTSMRACRSARRLSVRQLSELSGVCEATIYHAERDITYPGILTIVACADALGMGIDEYIGREVKK